MVVDNASSVSLLRLSYGIEVVLLDQVTRKNRDRHKRYIEVDVEALFVYFVSQEQRKKYEKRDENMSKVMTQLDILTKHIIEASCKEVNVVSAKSVIGNYAEEVDYNDEEFFLVKPFGRFPPHLSKAMCE